MKYQRRHLHAANVFQRQSEINPLFCIHSHVHGIHSILIIVTGIGNGILIKCFLVIVKNNQIIKERIWMGDIEMYVEYEMMNCHKMSNYNRHIDRSVEDCKCCKYCSLAVSHRYLYYRLFKCTCATTLWWMQRLFNGDSLQIMTMFTGRNKLFFLFQLHRKILDLKWVNKPIIGSGSALLPVRWELRHHLSQCWPIGTYIPGNAFK